MKNILTQSNNYPREEEKRI